MSINANAAREAWKLLWQGMGTVDSTPFEDITAEQVKSRYRYCTLFTHPDREGGTIEKFAAVDRAKHLLLHWLARAAPAPDPAMASACERCTGLGYVSYPRGFSAPMRVTCPACRGTGDSAYEHEKGDAR